MSVNQVINVKETTSINNQVSNSDNSNTSASYSSRFNDVILSSKTKKTIYTDEMELSVKPKRTEVDRNGNKIEYPVSLKVTSKHKKYYGVEDKGVTAITDPILRAIAESSETSSGKTYDYNPTCFLALPDSMNPVEQKVMIDGEEKTYSAEFIEEKVIAQIRTNFAKIREEENCTLRVVTYSSCQPILTEGQLYHYNHLLKTSPAQAKDFYNKIAMKQLHKRYVDESKSSLMPVLTEDGTVTYKQCFLKKSTDASEVVDQDFSEYDEPYMSKDIATFVHQHYNLYCDEDFIFHEDVEEDEAVTEVTEDFEPCIHKINEVTLDVKQ